MLRATQYWPQHSPTPLPSQALDAGTEAQRMKTVETWKMACRGRLLRSHRWPVDKLWIGPRSWLSTQAVFCNIGLSAVTQKTLEGFSVSGLITRSDSEGCGDTRDPMWKCELSHVVFGGESCDTGHEWASSRGQGWEVPVSALEGSSSWI